MSEAKQTAKLALEALEDKKAMDVRILDITHVSTLADYFMIASGSNRNQVQAMADNVEEVLGKAGVHPKQIEGYQTANWSFKIGLILNTDPSAAAAGVTLPPFFRNSSV